MASLIVSPSVLRCTAVCIGQNDPSRSCFPSLHGFSSPASLITRLVKSALVARGTFVICEYDASTGNDDLNEISRKVYL